MTSKAAALHHRAAALLVELVRYRGEHGYGPSLRELQDKLGVSSMSVVAYHLRALEAENLIARAPGLARAITPTERGEAMVESLRAKEVAQGESFRSALREPAP